MNYNGCLNSGIRQGGYMTTEDFKRYFAARRRVTGRADASSDPENPKHLSVRSAGTALGPTIVRRYDNGNTCAGHEGMRSGETSANTAGTPALAGIAGKLGRAGKLVARVEKVLGEKDMINKAIKLADEWIAVDPKEYRVEGERKKIPYQMMLMIITFSLSLLLIVSGSVLHSKATMELRAMENELEELAEYKEELEQKLEIKNDLRYIEQVARTKLGMIDKVYAPVKHLGSEPEEKVILYDTGDSDRKVGLSTLLSALGFPE
ncbi:MAG: hypothetical protein GX057_02895 [Clostridiales bacterium]|jgi:cell division protein FtsB|nr:hypothetical protein [Clostridiales bacterium]